MITAHSVNGRVGQPWVTEPVTAVRRVKSPHVARHQDSPRCAPQTRAPVTRSTSGPSLLPRPTLRVAALDLEGSGPPMPGSSLPSGRCFSSSARTGRPAAFHPSKPPTMSVARLHPSSRRLAAAKLEENPWAQKRTRRQSIVVMYGLVYPESGSTRHSSTERGMCSDPGTTPWRRRSSCDRRSTRTAPSAIARPFGFEARSDPLLCSREKLVHRVSHRPRLSPSGSLQPRACLRR